MIELNINSVENLIFQDKKVQSLLPDFTNLFSQWQLGKILNLKSQVNQATLDLLNLLEDSHVEILEEYFNNEISIKKLNYRVAKNISAHINDLECVLKECEGYAQISTYRKGEYVYLSMWR